MTYDRSDPINVKARSDYPMPSVAFCDDPLFWGIMQLQVAPEQHGRLDPSQMFAFLDDHLSKSSASERARVEQMLYRKLSDYVAIHEMFLAVCLHRPASTMLVLSHISEPSIEGYGDTLMIKVDVSSKLLTTLVLWPSF